MTDDCWPSIAEQWESFPDKAPHQFYDEDEVTRNFARAVERRALEAAIEACRKRYKNLPLEDDFLEMLRERSHEE